MRARTAWVFVFVLPLMIPPQVIALAWLQLTSPASPVLQLLGLDLPRGWLNPLYSPGGMIFLLGVHSAPHVFLAARASLCRVPGDLVEAARTSGASPLRCLFDVVLPMARSGLLAGAAMAFVSGCGNFGIQAMLGVPAGYDTLVTMIYRQMNNYGPLALPDAALLSLLLSVIIVAVLLGAGWLSRRGDNRVSSLDGGLVLPLGRARLPVEILVWTLALAILVLPLYSLAGSSLLRGYGQELTWRTITLHNYTEALFRQTVIREAMLTSIGLTAVTVVVLVAMSFLLAYFISWHRGPAVSLMHLGSELAYALPGAIIAIAAILFFLRPLPVLGVSIYGTVWIILATYLSNYLAVALRQTLAGFSQIDPTLEDAARSLGAGLFRRLRDVILPLAGPAALAGGFIVMLSVLKEIQISAMLVSLDNQTIGPTILFLEEAGETTLAAAVGCLMILVVLAILGVAVIASRRLPKGIFPWQI